MGGAGSTRKYTIRTRTQGQSSTLGQEMDFTTAVRLARELHVEARPLSEIPHPDPYEMTEAVYGRVCSSESADHPPEKLTSTPGRKTAFVFGPDAVASIILGMESYSAVSSLGFTRDYIRHELIEKKCSYWLILFKPTEKERDLFVPATWDGVTHLVHSMYPKVYPDLLQHLPTLENTPFSDFEIEAGFKFLECKRNMDGSFPDKPPFYNYDLYCSIPAPHTALQVRLFLYCEMRLLEMFRGDGYAATTEPGSVCSLEYLCPNLKLSDFDAEHLAILPMPHILIPDS